MILKPQIIMKLFKLIPLLMASAASLLLTVGSARSGDYPMTVGIQTWTLRNMDFDQVVDFCVRHKIKYVQMIDKHINPKGPLEETKRKKAILDKNGLVCYTFG